MNEDFGQLRDDELEELKRVFYANAYEIVENLQDSVLRLEADPEDEDALKAVKRYIHTLKGDSNSVGLTQIGTLCHRMEDMLTSVIEFDGHIGGDAIDLLLNSADGINRILMESEAGREGAGIGDLIGKIEGLMGRQGRHLQPGHAAPERPSHSEYHELQIEDAVKGGLHIYEAEIIFHPLCSEKAVSALMLAGKLNSAGQVIRSSPDINDKGMDGADRITFLLASALGKEELKKEAFITGITGEINIKDYSPNQKKPGSGVKDAGIKTQVLRVDVSRVDHLMNLIGELIIGRSMMEQVVKDISEDALTTDIASRLASANSYMDRTVSDLQKGIMKMRMVPINHVFRKFPKMARDLSAEKGKTVRLEIYGRETELDKGVVDALDEPLAHIIRNSIDHGIEAPSIRKSSGKPAEGVITMRAYHEATQIVIEVSDDGKGIDTDALRKKAGQTGILSEAEAGKLNEAEALNLIFLSGLSTSETVTETSGRGIGMDAVKAAIEDLKGSIEVESGTGRGTRFRLRLPLTLAVIKALLFEAGEKLYALALSSVSEVARIAPETLTTIDGKSTLLLRDRIVSIIRLDELFRRGSNGNGSRVALILAIRNKKAGILIDRLVGQQDIVVKAVDGRYAQSGLISGASILGDGRVVLILDAPAVFNKAVEAERKQAVGI